jgi:hypothetical protein
MLHFNIILPYAWVFQVASLVCQLKPVYGSQFRSIFRFIHQMYSPLGHHCSIWRRENTVQSSSVLKWIVRKGVNCIYLTHEEEELQALVNKSLNI